MSRIFPPIPDTEGAPASTLLNNLRAYWTLDEAEGATRIDAVAGLTLTDFNSVPSVPGVQGNAAGFTSANDTFLAADDDASYEFGDNDFTMAFWVSIASTNTALNILGKDMGGFDTNEHSYLFEYIAPPGPPETSEILVFKLSNDGNAGTQLFMSGMFPMVPNQKYFIVVRHDATNDIIDYVVDGTITGQTVHTGGVYDGPTRLMLGAVDETTVGNDKNHADIEIDELGIWDRRLSDTEIVFLHNNAIGKTHPFADTLRAFPVIPDERGFPSGLPAPTGPSTLLTGLIAFWKLEEASGTRVDEVGSNDLTDNATVTGAVGKVGNAAQFTNATSEFLSIADNTDLSTGNISFTIAGWVWLDNKTGQQGIVSKWLEGSANREYLIDYLGGGTDRFRFGVSSDGAGGGTTTVVQADNHGSPSTGVWVFFACWHDSVADTISIQINNGMIDSSATSAGVFDSVAPVQFGATDTAVFLDGRMDAVGFWKKVLTADEKTEFFNGDIGLEHPF